MTQTTAPDGAEQDGNRPRPKPDIKGPWGRFVADPIHLIAAAVITIGLVAAFTNLSRSVGGYSALGVIAGAECVVAIAAGQSVKASRVGDTYRMARFAMWSIPAMAIGANFTAAMMVHGITWHSGFLYALAPLGTCTASEYIAYGKRKDVETEDGITAARRNARAAMVKAEIQYELDQYERERNMPIRRLENSLFYWESRRQKGRGLFRWWAEHKLWKLKEIIALDDTLRAQMTKDGANRILDAWITETVENARAVSSSVDSTPTPTVVKPTLTVHAPRSTAAKSTPTLLTVEAVVEPPAEVHVQSTPTVTGGSTPRHSDEDLTRLIESFFKRTKPPRSVNQCRDWLTEELGESPGAYARIKALYEAVDKDFTGTTTPTP